MKPTPEMYDLMDDHRKALTNAVRALGRVCEGQASAAMVLADVLRWQRAYARGQADPEVWFDLDTLACTTLEETRRRLDGQRDQHWLNRLRQMPAWADFIDGVLASGGDPVFECQLMLMRLRDQMRRAA